MIRSEEEKFKATKEQIRTKEKRGPMQPYAMVSASNGYVSQKRRDSNLPRDNVLKYKCS